MQFLVKHAAILLYAGFWISLSSYGLSAPPERVAMLESGLVTQGWHLTAMALLFGGPVLVIYAWRMRQHPMEPK
jgi:hypothetical protein